MFLYKKPYHAIRLDGLPVRIDADDDGEAIELAKNHDPIQLLDGDRVVKEWPRRMSINEAEAIIKAEESRYAARNKAVEVARDLNAKLLESHKDFESDASADSWTKHLIAKQAAEAYQAELDKAEEEWRSANQQAQHSDAFPVFRGKHVVLRNES